jgi:hypothetical protein
MTTRSRICSTAGLAIAGLLAFGLTGASAQAIYVDSYAAPYPVADPYPVAVAPGSVYVAPGPVVAAPPIVRPRTVVVSRRAYVPPPAFGAPVPYDYAPYGYTTDVGYTVSDW